MQTFQKHPLAWHISLQLISESCNPNVQFFGASTLYQKISLDWNTFEHSLENIQSLQTSLYNVLIGSCNGKSFVTSKLCQCLACFILKSGTKNFMIEFIQRFENELKLETVNQERSIGLGLCILEFFGTMIEQFLKSDLNVQTRYFLSSIDTYKN